MRHITRNQQQLRYFRPNMFVVSNRYWLSVKVFVNLVHLDWRAIKKYIPKFGNARVKMIERHSWHQKSLRSSLPPLSFRRLNDQEFLGGCLRWPTSQRIHALDLKDWRIVSCSTYFLRFLERGRYFFWKWQAERIDELSWPFMTGRIAKWFVNLPFTTFATTFWCPLKPTIATLNGI